MNLGSHISRRFNLDLERLRTSTLELGGLVERQLKMAAQALELSDSNLAIEVVAGNEQVKALEHSLEDLCTHIIVKRQPAAGDLRLVLASGRIVRELSRMGKDAVNLAELGLKLTEQGGAPVGYIESRQAAKTVRDMLNHTLDAFARGDTKLALSTIAADKDIDVLQASTVKTFIKHMTDQPGSIATVLDIMEAMRTIESMGDHIANICEQILYIVTGEYTPSEQHSIY